MSVITETEPGGEMVCIQVFSARPRGAEDQPVPGSRRRFHVGERVRYITYFYQAAPADNPTGYMAVFEPIERDDHTRYAATQNYFVSLDCWEGLRHHFASVQATGTEQERSPAAPKRASDPVVATAKKPRRSRPRFPAMQRSRHNGRLLRPHETSAATEGFRKTPECRAWSSFQAFCDGVGRPFGPASKLPRPESERLAPMKSGDLEIGVTERKQIP